VKKSMTSCRRLFASRAAAQWSAAQYVQNQHGFQSGFAESCLHRGNPTLTTRLASAASLVDIGCGTGEHTRLMSSLMPDDAFTTGVDTSPQMQRAARKLQARCGQITHGAQTRFIAEDCKDWLPRDDYRGSYDIATSFMAMHWVAEDDIPATLAGIRHALDDRHGFFVASFHGEGSAQVLIDAIHHTIDAAVASRNGTAASAENWTQAAAALVGEKWASHFPNGRNDFECIPRLSVGAWRRYLDDAGFETLIGSDEIPSAMQSFLNHTRKKVEDEERGAEPLDTGALKAALATDAETTVSMRTVDSVYADASATQVRLNAAWGPMLPTIAVDERKAFFADVAAEAVRAATASDCDPQSVVVENHVIEIAVGVKRPASV
jgi:SAM-dependent methyltransferase